MKAGLRWTEVWMVPDNLLLISRHAEDRLSACFGCCKPVLMQTSRYKVFKTFPSLNQQYVSHLGLCWWSWHSCKLITNVMSRLFAFSVSTFYVIFLRTRVERHPCIKQPERAVWSASVCWWQVMRISSKCVVSYFLFPTFVW